MRKIIILGAGIYQVPLIKRAKEMGLFTIVCSVPGNYPGFSFADRVHFIDTTNISAVLKLAKKEKIDGICTTGTDVAVPTIGYVCDNMGLSGIQYSGALKSTNKSLMKDAMRSAGVKTSDFILIHSLSELEIAYKKLSSPCVLKVVDKSGSRGIVKVTNGEELNMAYHYARQYTDSDILVLEKFVEGKEIGVDGFVWDDEIVFFMPHNKLTISNGKTDIPLGHEIPIPLDETLYLALYSEVKKSVRALEIQNTAFNADIIVTPNNDISILEMGGRSGATGIPEIIENSTGIDYYEQILRAAIGQKPDFTIKKALSSISHLIFSDKSGRLQQIIYPNIQGITYEQDVSIGDYISKIENGTNRIGVYYATEKTLPAAREKINSFNNGMKVIVE